MADDLGTALKSWQRELEQTSSFQRLVAGEEEQFWECHAEQYYQNRTAGPHYTAVLDWLLEVVPPQATLLEIGPGPGIFTLPLARHCSRVTAIEPSPAVVNFLQRQAGGLPNLTIIQDSWEECVVDSHDVVLAAGVLYVFYDLSKALEMMLRSATHKVLLIFVEADQALLQELAATLHTPPPSPGGPSVKSFFRVLNELTSSYVWTRLVEQQIYHYPNLEYLCDLWSHSLKLTPDHLPAVRSFLAEKGILDMATGDLTIPRCITSHMIEVSV